MAQKIEVIFVLDGGPQVTHPHEGWSSCSVDGCGKDSVGTFIVLDKDNQELGSVQFCEEHGKKLATGGI